MRTRSFESVLLDQEQLEFESDNILRKCGWQFVCNTPGSLWLWQRDLGDGRMALVNKVTAIGMQSWFNFSQVHPIVYNKDNPKQESVPIHVHDAVTSKLAEVDADRKAYRERIREYQNEIEEREKKFEKERIKLMARIDKAEETIAKYKKGKQGA